MNNMSNKRLHTSFLLIIDHVISFPDTTLLMALSKPQTSMTPQHYLECETFECERNCQFYCNYCTRRLCEQCREEHLKGPGFNDH